MSAESTLIDRIVHGVLTQLAGGEVARDDAPTQVSPGVARPETPARAEAALVIGERIVTAELLAERLSGSTRVAVSERAIVTPAAWDLIRERGVTVQRGDSKPQAGAAGRGAPADATATSTLQPLLFVVRNTPAVDRLHEDLKATWRRELLGCPDDAAELAISAIARGETTAVVILAAQTHRAACLANRNESVKAVAVRDAADVPVVRKQLRANVWCVDPTDRSWFELRNLMRAVNS